MNRYVVFAIAAFLSISAFAESNQTFAKLSPKLRKFLKETPTASQLFTNCISEAFSNRRLEIVYFYTDDESIARAAHYYSDQTSVSIAVRENQMPVDEYICILFESYNSLSQAKFVDLATKAENGHISKNDFIREMMKVEFSAVRRTTEALGKIRLGEHDVDGSYYYLRFKNCPDTFKEYLKYSKKVASPWRDSARDWASNFDQLRQTN